MASPTKPGDLPSLPPRDGATHKGDYGHVLVAAGSVGMTGAAALTLRGALRSGAGLVSLVCPKLVWQVVAPHVAEAMVHPVGSDNSGQWDESCGAEAKAFAETLSGRVVLAVGPGIGRSEDASKCARELVLKLAMPLVLDADGLVAFVDRLDELKSRTSPTVITPHPGEAAMLIGKLDGRDHAARRDAAVRLADKTGAVVLLKGHNTVVTTGDDVFINPTGNPGMATGGSGDVLTGIIAGLMAQGATALDAARLGAYLHGLAGDLAAEELGLRSVIAGDLAKMLPAAMRKTGL